jgi:flagellar assembly protein FliH
MPTVIRAAEHRSTSSPKAFNFVDMSAQAQQYLTKVRAEAAQLIAQARREADALRSRAKEEGRQAALQEVEAMVRKQLATAFPAVQRVLAELENSKHAWLRHWESSAVHVATAMAARVIRREVRQDPEITLTLVREALELAAGNTHLRIHLNPDDCKALGNQVQMLIDELAPLAGAEVQPDPDVMPGSCRLETRFGIIDERFDAQLKRIEEELMQ